MSIIVKSGSTSDLQTVTPKLAGRVAGPYPATTATTNGFYHLGATSGLVTGVAAGDATNGHLFAFRNTSATLMMVTRLQFQWFTTTGFTAAQEFRLALFRLTGYTASHTGGTAITAAGAGGMKRRSSYANSVLGDARIATTVQLTAGTHTFDAQPWMTGAYSELAAAATVQMGRFEREWRISESDNHPLVLTTNEGIVVRNEIAMGAGGVGRLSIEVDWFEDTSW